MRKSAILFVALVVALGLAPGCSRRRSDQDIATEIKAKMYSAPELKATNVDVVTKDGEVTLGGEVPNDAARYQAFKLASDTPGVTKVTDHMFIKAAEATPPPEPQPEPAPARASARKVIKPTHVRGPAQTEAAAPPSPPPPAAQTAAAQTPPPPPQPTVVEIPAGTAVTVRMIDSIDSEINHTGEVFHASLDAPLVMDNEIVVPTGTDAYVKLVEARSAGHMSGRSELGLELVRMQFQSKSYVLESTEYKQVGTSRGKRTAATIGGGAAIGAAIGAIAGGGKGAAIGAGVGAGSGTVYQAATKGKQIKIPSETKLEFRLQQPVEIRYFPEKNKSRR